MEKRNKKRSLKDWFKDELIEYLINVVYLSLFFGTFAWYHRLILSQYQISYLNYGASIIQALILGKVIMIGKFIRIGNRFEKNRLILSATYKAMVFLLFIFLFSLLEYAISGIIHGLGAFTGVRKHLLKDRSELIAENLVIFCALVPFFSFKELARIFGEERVRHLFFHKQANEKISSFR